MAFDTLLIQPNEARARVPVSPHLENKWWQTIIYPTQVAYIRPVLGAALYEELQTQIETNTVTLENQALLARLYDPLAWRIYSESLKVLNTRTENIGERKNKDDHSDAAAAAEVTQKKLLAASNADSLMEWFICWLNDNKADYPLFDSSQSAQSPPTRYGLYSVNKDRPVNNNNCKSC